MGKRELLLIAVFGILGLVAYRLTAPPTPDGGGFSIGAWLDRARREIQDERVQLPVTRSAEAPVPASVRRVRVDVPRGTWRVTGEDRETVAAELTGTVHAVDEAEAQGLAGQIALTAVPEGDRLVVRLLLPPPEQRRRLPLELHVRVPRRLVLDLATQGGQLDVTGVAGVTLERASGRARLLDITGPVTGEFSSGALEITRAASLDLKTRRTEVRIVEVGGAAQLESAGGDLRLRGVKGTTTLKMERLDAELEDLAGPLTVTGSGGQLRVRDARGAITCDTRRVELLLAPAVPVAVTASTEGDLIDLTLPAGGVTLEARAQGGDIRVPDGTLTVKGDDEAREVQGALRGGGPKVTLRTTRGDIVVR